MALSLPTSSQPRRSKTILSPEGATAKFLYTIIKQLDLKSIDWNEVASQLDITNGHAARMRYSRFKSQIEGLSKDANPKAKSAGKDHKIKHKGKGKRSYDDMQTDISYSETISAEDDGDSKKRFKHELETAMQLPGWNRIVKTEQDLQTSNNASSHVKTEHEMQPPRIHHNDIAKTSQSEPQAVHTNVVDDAVVHSQAGKLSQHAPLSASVPSGLDVTTKHSFAPSAPGFMPSRPQYRRYYPQYTGIQYGPQYRQHPMTYQQMMPQYERLPSNHYQHFLQPSMYTPSAYELAAQASYPWPYSEASIPQSVKHNDGLAFGIETAHEITDLDNLDLAELSKDLENWNAGTTNFTEASAEATSTSTTQASVDTTEAENLCDEQILGDGITISNEVPESKTDSAHEQPQAIADEVNEADKKKSIEAHSYADAEGGHKESAVDDQDLVIVKIEPEVVMI